jgi:hypothetical protein
VFTPSADKLTARLTSTSVIPAGADYQFQITVRAKNQTQTLESTRTCSIDTLVPTPRFGAVTLNTGRTVILQNANDFNKLCVSTTMVTINGVSFARTKIVGFKFGLLFDLTKLPDYFLSEVKINTNEPYFTIPDCITDIGNNVFFFSTFLKPIQLPKHLTSIGINFLVESTYP